MSNVIDTLNEIIEQEKDFNLLGTRFYCKKDSDISLDEASEYVRKTNLTNRILWERFERGEIEELK